MKYFLIVAVRFRSPVSLPKKMRRQSAAVGNLATGFYRNLGITADSEAAARTLAENEIGDGFIDWSDSSVRVFDSQTACDSVVFHSKTSDCGGVWYRSGRMFFPPD
jgi:hypothetical protein